MRSLIAGTYAIYLLLVLVMVAVGPLILLRERRQRRADHDSRSTDP